MSLVPTPHLSATAAATAAADTAVADTAVATAAMPKEAAVPTALAAAKTEKFAVVAASGLAAAAAGEGAATEGEGAEKEGLTRARLRLEVPGVDAGEGATGGVLLLKHLEGGEGGMVAVLVEGEGNVVDLMAWQKVHRGR